MRGKVISTPEDYQAMLDAQAIAAAERVVEQAERNEPTNDNE